MSENRALKWFKPWKFKAIYRGKRWKHQVNYPDNPDPAEFEFIMGVRRNKETKKLEFVALGDLEQKEHNEPIMDTVHDVQSFVFISHGEDSCVCCIHDGMRICVCF